MRLPETLIALPVTLRDSAYGRMTPEFAGVVDQAFDAVWLTNRDGAIVAWQFESEITLCCKLLKTQASFCGWVLGTISATGWSPPREGWFWEQPENESLAATRT